MAGVLIGCLYLPNGNPAAGPEVRLQARMDRPLHGARRRTLLAAACPVVLAGDYNVIPTDQDVYKPERWVNDALFPPEPRAHYRRLLDAGLDRRAAPPPPGRDDLHLLGLLAATPSPATPASASTICC